MADTPFDDESLDNLEDALNISKSLLGNAKELGKIYKSLGLDIDNSLVKSTKLTSKNIAEILSKSEKLAQGRLSNVATAKLQEKVEANIVQLESQRSRLEDGLLVKSKEDLSVAEELSRIAYERIDAAEKQYGRNSKEVSLAIKLNNQLVDTVQQIQLRIDKEEEALDRIKSLQSETDKLKGKLSDYVKGWTDAGTKVGFVDKLIRNFKKLPIVGNLVSKFETKTTKTSSSETSTKNFQDLTKTSTALSKTLNTIASQSQKISNSELKKTEVLKLQKKLQDNIRSVEAIRTKSQETSVKTLAPQLKAQEALRQKAIARLNAAVSTYGADSKQAKVADAILQKTTRSVTATRQKLALEQKTITVANQLLRTAEEENASISQYVKNWDLSKITKQSKELNNSVTKNTSDVNKQTVSEKKKLVAAELQKKLQESIQTTEQQKTAIEQTSLITNQKRVNIANQLVTSAEQRYQAAVSTYGVDSKQADTAKAILDRVRNSKDSAEKKLGSDKKAVEVANELLKAAREQDEILSKYADNPLDLFSKEALERLEDSVGFSRALLDNATALNKIFKKEGSSQEFLVKSTRSLANTLTQISNQASKATINELSKTDALKLQKKLEQDILNITGEKNRLEQQLIPAAQADYEATKQSRQESERRLEILKQELQTAGPTQREAISQQIVAERERLSIAQEAEAEAKTKLRTEQDALEAINNTIPLAEQQNQTLEKYIQNWNKANLKLGIFGKVLNGIKKIPILGDLFNANKALLAMQKSALQGKGAFQNMAAGIKGAFEGIEKSTVILAAISAAIKIAKFFIEAMFQADERVTALARSLVITKDQAREVYHRFQDIADAGEKFARIPRGLIIGYKEILEAQARINEAFGTSVDLSQDLGDRGKILVAQFATLTKGLRLSEEEQKGLLNLNAQTGEEVQKTSTTILGQAKLYKTLTGYQVNERKILTDVLKTSNAIKLSIKGGTDALIKSVLNAQHLGLSMEKLNDIASGLLDFESSIQSQMEAELLTGRQLNLDKLRYAALTNDQVTMTQELNRLVSEAGPDFEKNRLAQEAVAKALGVSREELADMVTQQKIMNATRVAFSKISKEEREDIIKKAKLAEPLANSLRAGTLSGAELYKVLQSAGKSASDLQTLFGKQAETALASQTAQDKFNDSLERAKEIFTKFVDGKSLDKLADLLTDIVRVVGEKGVGGLFSFFGKSDLQKQQEATAYGKATETVKTIGAKAESTRTEEEKAQYREAFATGLKLHPHEFGELLRSSNQILPKKQLEQQITGTISEAEGTGHVVHDFTVQATPSPNQKINVKDFTIQKNIGRSVEESKNVNVKDFTINPTPVQEPEVRKNQDIKVQDFKITPLPQDTITVAGGTKLGRTDEMVAMLKKIHEVLTGHTPYLQETAAKNPVLQLDSQKISSRVVTTAMTTPGHLGNPSSVGY